MILIPNIHGGHSPDAQVIGNLIDHFGKVPNPCGNGAQGIYVATAGGQIYNNISTRNAYSGLQYYDQACNARISNNVFANNTVGMVLYGGNGCSPVGLNTVANNVIVNNVQQAFNNSFSGDQGCSTSNPTLYTNNVLFGNGSTFTSSPASCTTQQSC
jgi:Right handed beta helix region